MQHYKRMKESRDLYISKSWYVLKTKPMTEKKVLGRLVDKGIVAYLPLYTTLRQWSDRKKKVTVPLISSVVFIYSNPEEITKTYDIQGVNGVLKFLGKPALVKEQEIDNLRILLNEWDEEAITPCPECLEAGVSVEVIKGPFAGLIASTINLNGKNRVIVKIESLGANFQVNVPRSFLRKTNKKAA